MFVKIKFADLKFKHRIVNYVIYYYVCMLCTYYILTYYTVHNNIYK